ncbi:histidine phosphatase family protein [Azospirillum picis]|uniref:Phosphoglycerate mutase n=1 Tax=Azospirillum picis TaxID=488438 RepID=A0ABU0MTA1_9PROT|nr:histidine phosphatase family protein [Azospirillum picis]MBP2301969.1 putative phosphoglycerate mutase [Azospirillum picis]MDQ0536418.1 putative phosphoglycerate mutase [Azospirillum picis]
MTTLLILRHGPTAWNAEGRIQGSIDEPLSVAGRARVARYRLPPEAAGRRWIASPKRRAWETAQLLGLDPEPESRIVEMDWGTWEGRRTEELRAGGLMPDRHDRLGLDFKAPGGESPREVQARLRPWLTDLATDGRPAGAVAHNGILRALYALATGWDMRGPPAEELADGCAHLFALGPGSVLSLLRLNIPLVE